MVFRKSGGGSAVKNMQAKNKGKTPVKKVQDPFDLMDMDDDSGEATLQRTPANKTPKGRQSLTDKKKVSFQIPGKLTPAKTPNKGGSAVKHVPTPGSKKKTAVPQFKGMKGGKNQTPKKDAEDSDDDDEDDDDDEELDLDMALGDDDDDDDLDLDSDDDEDDDEDDDDDDEDDDDDDDDDDEDDDEEEGDLVKGNKKQTIVKKETVEITKQKTPVKKDKKTPETPKAKNAVNNKSPQKRKAESDDEDDDDEDDEDEEDSEEDEDDSEEDVKPAVNGKGKDKPVKSEKAETPKGKKAANENKSSGKLGEETQKEVLQRKKEMNSHMLWVGSLPPDVQVDELKALSPDVINVVIPLANAKKSKARYAFLVFKSEKKAEENLPTIKTKKVRGQMISVDFVGEKSHNNKVAKENKYNLEEKNFNKKKLHISGLPLNVTIDQVAKIFPNAYQVSLNKGNPEYRTACVNFLTEEAASEAFKSNQKSEILGQKILVLYSIQGKPPKKHRRPVKHNKGAPFKKQKMADKS